jgi:membrane protein DedA with SNARE-associated domain
LLYGGLGYAFGSQWELISNFISDFSGLLVGLVVLGVGIYLMFRWFRKSAPETTVVPSMVESADS